MDGGSACSVVGSGCSVMVGSGHRVMVWSGCSVKGRYYIAREREKVVIAGVLTF